MAWVPSVTWLFESVISIGKIAPTGRSTLNASWHLILTWLLFSVVSSIWTLRYRLALRYVSLYGLIMTWSLIRDYRTSIASRYWQNYSSQLSYLKDCIYRTLERWTRAIPIWLLVRSRCIAWSWLAVRLVRDLITSVVISLSMSMCS